MSTSRSIRNSLFRRSRTLGTATVLAVASVCLPRADAHGFGQRYDLPLPLSLYLAGTAAAVVFSFVIVGLFLRRPDLGRAHAHRNLLAQPIARALACAVLLLLRVTVLGVFVVMLAAGFFGNQDPYQNLAPTLTWIIGWVGFAYVSAFVGDCWGLINPWRTLFGAFAWVYAKTRSGRGTRPWTPYPETWGVWPAFVLLFAFSWVELVYPSPAVPAHIAWMALGYSLVTLTAMAVFGAETWLRRGEFLTVAFGVLAQFAPTQIEGREWRLRPFARGLIEQGAVSRSMTALVLLILSTVLFDGVLATPQWNDLESQLAAWLAWGDASSVVIRTLGLALFWLIFFSAFIAICACMRAAVRQTRGTWEIAQSFVLTLVPIAIAYHVAHYLAYLLVQGQYIVPLLSDPFGFGWDLLGTAGYRVDIGLVDARFEWYTAVIAIVLGHITAVYLAHVRAMAMFDAPTAAVRAEIPLTALMVGYTFVSLSILAEPITERQRSAPATMSASGEFVVPDDALIPEPASGRLQPVGPGRTAKSKLRYRILGSSFHDGTRTSLADFLYAYRFAYRWGSASPGGGDAQRDPVVALATEALRRDLVGIKFLGIDTTSKSFKVAEINVLRELFLFDVYSTKTPEIADQDAAYAPPWSTLPWHLLALMEAAVDRGDAAFSQEEATRRGVPWLDLVRSAGLNSRLAELVSNFEREGYRPESLRAWVSADDARKRWAALAAFYKEHGHFLVTNGPYVLKRWTADSVALEVFRDLSYPLGVGSYDAYAIPRRGFITGVERSGHRLTLAADIETIEKYQRSYDIVRKPLASVESDVLKRSAPECRYMLLGAAGTVVLARVALPGADRKFTIDLGGLPAGHYELSAEIVVDANAMNAEIRRIPIDIVSAP